MSVVFLYYDKCQNYKGIYRKHTARGEDCENRWKHFMWNCWDEHECAVAFEKAECGWRHLWNKYREYNSQNGHYGAVEEFFANLDDRNQNLLVERALEMYSGKKRIK